MGVFLGISIHALLAESDWRTCAACTAKQYFYPRSPCGERLAYFQPHALSVLFLSTLSLRRATRFQCGAIQHNNDFYPRSPCGERQRQLDAVTAAYMISIHALLAESDGVCNQKPPQARKFLSTLSLRRATGIITTFAIIAGHFYPRSPCGERPSPCVVMNGGGISIHALLAESDDVNGVQGYRTLISIHALLAESDCSGRSNSSGIQTFLSTLSLRRATHTASMMCGAL